MRINGLVGVRAGASVARLTTYGGVLLAALSANWEALGQPTSAPPIYSCVDSSGKRLTSDRPIAECSAREQRMLNPDGSVKRVLPPTLTADERSVVEAREREAAIERASAQDATRRDRLLLARFPSEAAHRKARESALDDVRKSVRVSQSRLASLAGQRKPLMEEAEFYAGKPLPAQLKARLDAIEASTAAHRALAQDQELEVLRIDKRYDVELERLKRLWAGALPGSMGILAGVSASAPRK